MQKVNLIYLQKTMKKVSCGLIRSLGVGRFVDWATSNVMGASGGILIFWDSRVLQLLEVEEGQILAFLQIQKL